MSVTTHRRPEQLLAPTVQAEISAVDLLSMEPSIHTNDIELIQTPEGRQRAYLRTVDGLIDPPVGILIENLENPDRAPFSYINTQMDVEELDPRKLYPYEVKSWQTYVESNSRRKGEPYRNPLLLEAQPEASTKQLGETMLVDALGGYKGKRRAESRWDSLKDKLKGKLRHALVQPMLTEIEVDEPRFDGDGMPAYYKPTHTEAGALVGPVESRLQPQADHELINTPIATILNQIGDPNIIDFVDFVREARKDPEAAKLCLKQVTRDLYIPLRRRAEQGDAYALEAAKALTNGLAELRNAAGLSNQADLEKMKEFLD